MPIDSDALRANAPHTAEAVTIPPEFQAILDSVANLTGVHQALSATLREYFHRYRNLDTVVENVGTLQLRYWSYLARNDHHAELFSIVCELVARLLRDNLTPEQISALLRSTFSWCREVAKAPNAGDYADSLATLVTEIRAHVDFDGDAFLERDNELREFAAVVSPDSVAAGPVTELYRAVLLAGHGRLGSSLDIPGWARSPEAQLTDADEVAALYADLSAHTIGAQADALRTASPEDVRSGTFRNYSSIVSSALNLLPKVSHLEDRFAITLFLLKDEALGYRQQMAMNELLNVVRKLVQPGNKVDAEMVLARLTAFFKDRGEEFLLMRLQCYEAVGVSIGRAGNERAADHLLDDILSWHFQYPDIEGATDDWETVVNPYHLPKIRCWMHIIESNPALFERLAAALNVQLRLGGVHIADTDLFQRDVTEFLNADIRPIYFVAKQLLRVFPVYFAEVGAEGELRAASTHFDEITLRRDTLLHFLRKQVHAESSNRLVPFSREVLRYWATLETDGLEPYLSDNTLAATRNEPEWAAGPHALLTRLREEGEYDGLDAYLDDLLERDTDELTEKLKPWAQIEGDAYRVAMLIRTHQLLKAKYSLVSDDLAASVRGHARLPEPVRTRFAETLGAWAESSTAVARDALLDAGLDVLAALKEIILDPAPGVADEQLYHKRHIAAGIPSIYGTYKEPKFDALGMSFRVESLISRLLEDVVAEGVEPYVTRETLRRMHTTMRRFSRALNIDGVESDNLDNLLDMLQASFSFHSFTFHQYQNVFQMIARAVSDLSSRSVRSHGQILRAILAHDSRPGEARGLEPDAVAEIVLREVLVSGLGIQTLDRFVGQQLHKLTRLNDKLDAESLTRMMNYDPERLVWGIGGKRPGDLATLGFKGFGLRQMAQQGLRVPEGFVLSTELFHAKPAMKYPKLLEDTESRLRLALSILEQQTGRTLGDPRNLLLLSVRSGSPISMPGLMTTFINVGLNEQNTAEIARDERFAWAAWDSYRRQIQTIGMYSGMTRDAFGSIITEAKNRHGIGQKMDFTAEQMRDIALAYKTATLDAGIQLIDDPFDQMLDCVWKVVDSWDLEDPRVFRKYTSVAENWGTAVICQRMVFGNLSRTSGSGVAFTSNPLEPYSHQVRLFGDFQVGSQGEDLVGGLVFPLPISENQREASALYSNTHQSLETMYPELYEELLDVARTLAGGPGKDPQEIEFTFESPTPEGLYILQKRAIVPEQNTNAPSFDTSSPEMETPVAVAMGVSGGAYVGRMALTEADVDAFVASGDPVILVRPDTVPEDLQMIARVEGILTGRGGATSHAAVTAKRLAKTAVAGCHALIVKQGLATIAGQEVRPGDWLSIDGRSGNIYLGRQPIAAMPSGDTH